MKLLNWLGGSSELLNWAKRWEGSRLRGDFEALRALGGTELCPDSEQEAYSS